MSLGDDILGIDPSLPARFERGRDGRFALEAVAAERKTLLSRERLVYRAAPRIDDATRTVRFQKRLQESSRGLVGGLTAKAETTSLHGKERDGTVAERSRYLGRRFDCFLDYGAVREAVEEAAQAQGYAFEVVLRERSV